MLGLPRLFWIGDLVHGEGRIDSNARQGDQCPAKHPVPSEAG